MSNDILAEEKIRKGEYTFREDRWKHVSEQGQDFVRKLLTVNPDDRMSASECLSHPWLAQMDGDRQSEASRTIGSPASVDELLDDLLRYKNNSHFKRAALTMMAHHLSTPHLTTVRDIFLALDTDRSGTITRDNFRDAFIDSDLPEDEKWRLFDCVDVAGDGEIHYSEFVAAMMQSRVQINQLLVREAFELFDVSRTGYITKCDLSRVLGRDGFEDVDVGTLISECQGCHPNSGIGFKRFDQLFKEDNYPEARINGIANGKLGTPRLRAQSTHSIESRSNGSTREGSLAGDSLSSEEVAQVMESSI